MKKVIFFIVCFTGFWWAYLELKKSSEQEYQKQELHRQNTIDSLVFKIDSLQYVADSLVEQYQLFDGIVEPVNNMIDIINAIIEVESSNNDSAYNAYEDAVGCLQIRKTMVNDVNRILKRQKSDLRFTYNSRWSRDSSIQMFEVYCKHYNLTTYEQIARCWNGGPRGINNTATVGYWEKVKGKIDS